jgi:hypothetical protein
MQPSVRVSVKLSAEGTFGTQVKIKAASEYSTNIGPSWQGRRDRGVWGCDTPPEIKLSANEGICRQTKNNLPQNVKLYSLHSRAILA